MMSIGNHESRTWLRVATAVDWSFKWRVPGVVGIVITIGSFLLVQHSIGFRPEVGQLGYASPWILGGMMGAASNLVVLNLSVVLHYMAKGSAPRKAILGATATFILLIATIVYLVLTVDRVGDVIQSLSPPKYYELRDAIGLATQARHDLNWLFWRTVSAIALLSGLVVGLDYLMFPDANKSARDALLIFDGAIVLAIMMTLLFPYFGGYVVWGRTWTDTDSFYDFLIDFKAGAIAFEILLACMLFDPRHFFSS